MTGALLAGIEVGRGADAVGRSLREGLAMLADTFWALVVGFALSGAVQAFVSRAELQARLGDHGPAAVTRASLYGAASSSCSYAASAMARTLVGRGADFVASMVFMVASTNLVVELGIVLAVLIGWQFVVAQVVGGVVMAALLALLGGLWLRGRALEEATRRATEAVGGDLTAGGGGVDANRAVEEPAAEPVAEAEPLGRRLRSRARWSDAATYALADLRMLRRELLVGFLAAGVIATLVPTAAWNALFLHGHGWLTTLENVAVGPLVALLSFVCSVGNVPLAAALWSHGIAFGGVVSFVFADLITLPLVIAYGRMYGARMARRLLATLWVVMSAAGLVTDIVFRGVGLIPTTRPRTVAAGSLRWGPTTIADVIALGLLGTIVWLARRRRGLGGRAGYDTDPVCGMEVEIAAAPVTLRHGGRDVRFCCDGCRDRFVADPERFARSGAGP